MCQGSPDAAFGPLARDSHVRPATAHAMWSSSLYIFSLRTPTALVSSNCNGAGIGLTSRSTEGIHGTADAQSSLSHECPCAHLRCLPLLSCKHHAILCEDAQRCTSIGDGLHGILHLIQAPLRTERCGARVIAAAHGCHKLTAGAADYLAAPQTSQMKVPEDWRSAARLKSGQLRLAVTSSDPIDSGVLQDCSDGREATAAQARQAVMV